MNRSDVHLLDLPDEILLIILKKLNNIDVLYSLLNINNERLKILAQEKIFSNTLKFVSIDNISSIDRFCIDILPRIHHDVRCFILEPVSSNHFTNESPLRYIFQQQITELILGNRDRTGMIGSSKKYTINVYGHILKFFKNLKYLSIIETFNPSYPRLSLHKLPPTTFFSSTLTHLCINIYTLDDCFYLLDGRFKQLSTLITGISFVDEFSSIIHNMDDLPNLKYFSLKCYALINQYDNKILPLLHRMSFLEKLTLYLRIKDRARFINNTHLQNEILISMPRLHSFTFYISTYHNTVDLFRDMPRQDNQRIVTNIGQQPIANIIHYTSDSHAVYHIFSFSFVFDHLEDIGNIFPHTIFNYVTYLLVQDIFPFNQEFFIRIARYFPLLNNLRIINFQPQSTFNLNTFSSDSNQSYSITEYPYLTSLDVRTADIDYAEQFLNETKTYAPYLTELTIHYRNLEMVTNNFTREETRRSCAKVKRLIMIDIYFYFPLL